MTGWMRIAGLAAPALVLSALADLPRGAAAYRALAAATPPAVATTRIGPGDTLDVAVFQEPDLSAKGLEVDTGGEVALPLVGPIAAAGRTAPELAQAIADRLGARFLRHPQVTVLVASAAAQRVVVQGEVAAPGSYPLHGPATLLEALALAHGETRVAALHEVSVFRQAASGRRGAVFDVARIRRGEAADPAIIGGDLVVVGHSAWRGAWHDLLGVAPLAAALRPF